MKWKRSTNNITRYPNVYEEEANRPLLPPIICIIHYAGVGTQFLEKMALCWLWVTVTQVIPLVVYFIHHFVFFVCLNLNRWNRLQWKTSLYENLHMLEHRIKFSFQIFEKQKRPRSLLSICLNGSRSHERICFAMRKT